MNLFELNMLASPTGGLLGGIAASRDLGAAQIATAGFGGAAIGVGLYFGIVWLGVLIESIANRGMPQGARRLDRAGVILGVIVLIPMMGLPLISAFVAHFTFDLIF